MFKLNKTFLPKYLTINRFKSGGKQVKGTKQQNDYFKTLNLPNPGKFELSMKKFFDLMLLATGFSNKNGKKHQLPEHRDH
jgi:hypothetical protein